MKTTSRLAAVLLGTATVFAPLSMTTAGPAAADNCEPSEPIVRVLFPNYEERVFDDRDSVLCYTLHDYVYPRLCDDPSTLLGSCVPTLRPDPFEPIVITSYRPNGGRIVCNIQTFLLLTAGISGPTCSNTA